MRNHTRVKDLMVPIQKYDTVDVRDKVGEVLNRFYMLENISADNTYVMDRTVFVVDESKKIIGKLSGYQLLRGLVPEFSAEVDKIRRGLRQMHIATAQFLERCTWMKSELTDLVEQETHKSIEEIMSPAHPSLKEDDSINLAIFIMFNEKKRQLLVEQNKEVVGVISLTNIFSEFLNIAKQCDFFNKRSLSPHHQEAWSHGNDEDKKVTGAVAPLGTNPDLACSV
ncbi:CBS domain-containing protein [Thermodesulfobacteriota bacterium]